MGFPPLPGFLPHWLPPLHPRVQSLAGGGLGLPHTTLLGSPEGRVMGARPARGLQ